MKEFKTTNRSMKASIAQTQYSKLPPQACDLEEVILGAVLQSKEHFYDLIEILQPETFYREEHRQIFEAILQLEEKGEVIDILTVTHQLKRNKTLEDVGGPFAITQLTNRIASAEHILFHARIVKEKWLLREIIRVSANMMKSAFEDSADCFKQLEELQRELDVLHASIDHKQAKSVAQMAVEVKTDIFQRGKEGDLPGESTGFAEIDEITMGLLPGNLIILAARPAMGKSALAMQIGFNVAENRTKNVLVYSLEMAAMEILRRQIASKLEINSTHIIRGKFSYEDGKRIENMDLNYPNLIIDDIAGITIHQLRQRTMKQLKRLGSLDLIIVDYLQLMKGATNRGSREQDISEISRNLKTLAKELNVPILALSQLSRKTEERKGNKPTLSDLRESGAIEQDADSVCFIYRPEYYGIEEDAGGQNLKGLAKIIIAKNRHGALGEVKLKFIAPFVKFQSLQETAETLFNQSKDEEQF